MADWTTPLPGNTAKAGDAGHPQAHNEIVDAIAEARTKVDAAEKTAEWDSVTGKPSTFAPTIGTTENTAKAGNYVPAWGDITGKPTIPSDQAAAVAALTERVEALEAAANPPAEG